MREKQRRAREVSEEAANHSRASDHVHRNIQPELLHHHRHQPAGYGSGSKELASNQG